MERFIKVMIVATIVILGCNTSVVAWDVVYDASTGLLPTEASPSWILADYGAPVSITEGTLHIGNSDKGGANYCRESAAIDVSVPVTMETRMCVQSISSGAADLTIGTYGCYVSIGIFPDHLVTTDRYYQSHEYWQDFRTYHTIRLAYDGDLGAYVWVDNQLALSWDAQDWLPSTGTPGGISFGSYLSDSYWQYVAYSKDFIPVPEPSSLLALASCLLPVGVAVMRRRR